MLINFTLEPIKILTSRLLVRHGGLVTKIRVKQKKKKTPTMHKATKTTREARVPQNRGFRHFEAVGSEASDLEEWRMVKSRWTASHWLEVI